MKSFVGCRVHSGLCGVRSNSSVVRTCETAIEYVASACLRAFDEAAVDTHGYMALKGSTTICGGAVRDFTFAAHIVRCSPGGQRGAGCMLRMHGVVLERYACGVCGSCGCEVALESCTFLGHVGVSKESMRWLAGDVHGAQECAGAVMLDACHAAIKDCVFRGNRADVICRDAESEVCVERCEFTGQDEERLTAVTVGPGGCAELQDCQFATTAHAVQVCGEGTLCTLRCCVVACVASSAEGGSRSQGARTCEYLTVCFSVQEMRWGLHWGRACGWRAARVMVRTSPSGLWAGEGR